MSGQMRCEPQPEWRNRDGWHWVQDVSGYFVPTCARWQFNGGGIWVFGGTQTARPSYAYRTGYRYLAPVATPAEVDALRAERDELAEGKRLAIAGQNHNAKLVEQRDAELAALRARVERLEAALRGLVADVADYPAWQRPCLTLDTARAALEDRT